jgi:hypothetical protein
MTRATLRLVLLLAVAFAIPRHAQAQIHRCTTDDGAPLYTDQKCEALGATDRPDPASAPTPNTGPKTLGASGSSRLYRAGCSRTLQDLVFELTSAVDARDVNRLASLYDWMGMSDSAANATMDRLESIVARPLADITPIEGEPAADTTILAGPDDVPRTSARRPPVGLRLEQVQSNGITPTHTSLGLRRKFGCWWITL